MLINKIITTALSIFTIGTFELSAASADTEVSFDSIFAIYETNKANLTPKTLGTIECSLEQIIENPNTSDDVLANAAKLLFTIGCTTLYLKAMHNLFHSPNFNGKSYRRLIRSINELKEIQRLSNNETIQRNTIENSQENGFDLIQTHETTTRENHTAQQSTKPPKNDQKKVAQQSTKPPENDKKKVAQKKRTKAERWRFVQ